MSNYPAWWNVTLTIYNKYENSSRQISWYKHTVTGCFWKSNDEKVIVGNTVLETNGNTCRIPKDDNFVEDYLWIALTAEEKATKFTLHPGDIIVRGTVTDTVDEYTAGSRSSDLIAKYKKLQGCMVVEEVTLNVDGNRCQEHYKVKGV